MPNPTPLPGVNFSADELAVWLLHAPDPYDTWLEFLQHIHPEGLTVVPIWYVTVVTDALHDHHITDAQARSLLTASAVGDNPAPPISLFTAWGQLMQTMAVTWPARRKRQTAALDNMNRQVHRTRGAMHRG